MESNKLTRSETSRALSTRYEPRTPQIREWIRRELGLLAIRFGQSLTPERLMLYSQDLEVYPQHRLEIAFKRLKQEWTAKDFGFPLPADITERMEVKEASGVSEWQGATEQEKAEREQFLNSQEAAEFVAELHKAANKTVGKRIQPVKQMPPAIERSDAELDRLWHEHQRKVQEAQKRFGTS